MKWNAFYFFFASLFSSCTGFVTKERIVSNFYLLATDDEIQMSLSYCDPSDKNGCLGIINATVFAVGYDAGFIIAKQHPTDFPNYPNKNITNYFILPLVKNEVVSINNFGLIGPLTLEEYIKKRQELQISTNLDFTIEKENLK